MFSYLAFPFLCLNPPLPPPSLYHRGEKALSLWQLSIRPVRPCLALPCIAWSCLACLVLCCLVLCCLILSLSKPLLSLFSCYIVLCFEPLTFTLILTRPSTFGWVVSYTLKERWPPINDIAQWLQQLDQNSGVSIIVILKWVLYMNLVFVLFWFFIRIDTWHIYLHSSVSIVACRTSLV